jgi:hypothetical protein
MRILPRGPGHFLLGLFNAGRAYRGQLSMTRGVSDSTASIGSYHSTWTGG